jgi:hypothetical protein
MISNYAMEPGFKIMNLVNQQILMKFFKDLHDCILTFHGVAEVFKGNSEGLGKVSLEELTEAIFIALPKISEEFKVG